MLHRMRAVGITEFGGPKALRILKLPEPEPGPGEIRLSVQAAAVNRTDLAFRAGLPQDRLAGIAPLHVPSMDPPGWSNAVGEGVVSWRVADAVMAIVPTARPQSGTYAEQVVVTAEAVARIRAGASLAAVAIVPMNASPPGWPCSAWRSPRPYARTSPGRRGCQVAT